MGKRITEIVNGVIVTLNMDVPQQEIVAYINRAEEQYSASRLKEMDIKVCGEDVELTYRFAPIPFCRTRRITGYLVGDVKRWNNAKAQEERDRVKHT